jgi:RND family efflux transporter MFP subunit
MLIPTINSTHNTMTNNRKFAPVARGLRRAALGSLMLTLHAVPALAEPPASVSVSTQAVQRAVLARSVRAYGIVSAAPGQTTSVGVPYAARVSRVQVTLGQTVRRGQVLFEVSADPAAVLAAAQAGSAVQLAAGELARTQSLFDARLATQSQLAGAQKALEDARQAEAAQRSLGVQDRPAQIRAPFDAVISQLVAVQGDQLQPGATVMQISRRAPSAAATLVLGVDPASAGGLHEGDTLSGRDLSSGQAFSGHIEAIGTAIDAQTQLVNVTARIDTAGGRIFAGSKVAVEIVQSAQAHWVLPRSAVLKDAQGAYVFQVQAGHAHRVGVAIAVENGARYGVDGPLDAALPVVISGNYELEDAMSVQTAAGAVR